ncbi:hypothetical protein DIPPA_04535 [Diplonema papillatum]|nr:hypothetical protein DIPPA_04535 [Diplonema papillatum]
MRQFEYIGVRWDLRENRFTLPEEWRLKAMGTATERLGSSEKAALREWWSLLGLVFRVAFVYEVNLCFLENVLSFARTWAKAVTENRADWSTTCNMAKTPRDEAGSFFKKFTATERWAYTRPAPPSEFDIAVWSDASTTGWAHVSQIWKRVGAVAVYGTWRRRMESGDMYVLEMLAAEKGINAAIRSGHKRIMLFVDNEATMISFQKGHSRSRLANSVLRRVYKMLETERAGLVVKWIPTASMPADYWSRLPDCGVKNIETCMEGTAPKQASSRLRSMKFMKRKEEAVERHQQQESALKEKAEKDLEATKQLRKAGLDSNIRVVVSDDFPIQYHALGRRRFGDIAVAKVAPQEASALDLKPVAAAKNSSRYHSADEPKQKSHEQQQQETFGGHFDKRGAKRKHGDADGSSRPGKGPPVKQRKRPAKPAAKAGKA